jgi:hypothetical protein
MNNKDPCDLIGDEIICDNIQFQKDEPTTYNDLESKSVNLHNDQSEGDALSKSGIDDINVNENSNQEVNASIYF